MSEEEKKQPVEQVVGDEYAIEPVKREEMVTAQYDRGTIETVKRAVLTWSDASDDELRIYLYACLIRGIHPLSGMLIPVKFTDNSDEGQGRKKMVFISTVDYFRSMSEDTGEYDGMDEPEFEGEEFFEFQGQNGVETIVHPSLARVRVYRKGIPRPFVGIARWSEFYPGDKRGHRWRKMPFNQLAKCAEAAARRLGFPKKLGRVYAVEEMDQAAEVQAVTNTNGKPRVGMPTPKAALGAPADAGRPAEADRKKAGQLTDAQEKRLYAIAKAGSLAAEEVKLFVNLKYKHDHVWQLKWKGENSEYDRACAALKGHPKEWKKWLAEQRSTSRVEPSDPEGPPEPSFLDVLRERALAAGYKTDQDIAAAIDADLEIHVPLDQIPTDRMSEILSFFESKATAATAGA